jgi:hypothetical protein
MILKNRDSLLKEDLTNRSLSQQKTLSELIALQSTSGVMIVGGDNQ